MMAALPFFLNGLLGWVAGHVSSLLDRHSHWLRLMNYPIGILGAALGTMLSQSLQSLQNKFLLAGLLASACALFLFRLVRACFMREGLQSNMQRGLTL